MTTADRYRHILAWFRENVPAPESELHYGDPYGLLVAVILSAQCTDKRVNLVTPPLLERFPTPAAMAAVSPGEIYPYIKSVSYPNNKAKNLWGMARGLVERFGGVVPEGLTDLESLPGVGRKTANVVRAVAFHQAAMPVDTHVFRVAARLGLTTGAKTPLQTEQQLTAGIPAEWLSTAHHWLILHGRYVCLARRPRCEACGLRPWCRYYAAHPDTGAKTGSGTAAKAKAKATAKKATASAQVSGSRKRK